MSLERPTLGQSRVRHTFNPKGDSLVDEIKLDTAELIDLCEENKTAINGDEVNRLWSLAQTAYEEAAMWAVKAATAGA